MLSVMVCAVMCATVFSVAVNASAQEYPPVADAGPDQTVNEGDIVLLNGSGSTGSMTGAWSIETIERAWYVGSYSSMALDSSGYPHIIYLA